MSRLANEVVFITGASSGIGAACARAFAREKCRLILAARRVQRLEAERDALRELGAPDLRVMRLDVRSHDEVAQAVERLPREWRSVEVLVNNAGLSRGLEPLHAAAWTTGTR